VQDGRVVKTLATPSTDEPPCNSTGKVKACRTTKAEGKKNTTQPGCELETEFQGLGG